MNPPPLPPPEGRLAPAARWVRGLAAFAPWIVLWAVLAAPDGSRGWWPTSRFLAWTGLPCPLCGGTRALTALLEGEIGRSLVLNPLALAAVAGAVGISLWLVGEAFTGRRWRLRGGPSPDRMMPWLLAVLGLFWAYHVAAAVLVPKRELLDAGGWVWRVFPMPSDSGGPTGADHE